MSSFAVRVGLAAVLLAGCSSGGGHDTAAPAGGDVKAPTSSSSHPTGTPAGAVPRAGHPAAGKSAAPAPPAAAVAPPSATQPQAASRFARNDPRAIADVVARLPKPSTRSGTSLSFSPAISTGTSILGDVGSVAWNISHRDADGSLRTWGSALYVSSRSDQALKNLRHSPAVSHYCPKGATPLTGVNRAGTVTVAVVCPDAHSPGNWWTVFQRADVLTYLVLATSDSSRAETVATGRAVFAALTAVSSQAGSQLTLHKPLPEPKS